MKTVMSSFLSDGILDCAFASPIGHSLADNILSNREIKSTIFLSNRMKSRMPHSIVFVPNNTSAAQLLTTPSQIRTCKSPIWMISSIVPATDIVCFAQSRALVWAIAEFAFCSEVLNTRHWLYLAQLLCQADTSLGAWLTSLIQL